MEGCPSALRTLLTFTGVLIQGSSGYFFRALSFEIYVGIFTVYIGVLVSREVSGRGLGFRKTRLRVSGAGFGLGSPVLGCRSWGSGLGVRIN